MLNTDCSSTERSQNSSWDSWDLILIHGKVDCKAAMLPPWQMIDKDWIIEYLGLVYLLAMHLMERL